MPLYEYECGACGHRFEKIQRFSDPLVQECVKCGSGPVHKLLSAPAIQFKGTGWYVTDYAGKKPEPAHPSQNKTDTSSSPASTPSTASDSSSSPAPAPATPASDKK